MPAKSSAPKSSELPTFETAMERLEHIVEEMESDKLPLDDLLKRFEEGTQLVKVCEERLRSAEQRIEIITRNATGQPEVVDFEPEKKAAIAPREDVSLF